jgi:hypothetical protein
MSLPELHEKWRDLYGNKPPRFKRSFIQKRLAYRIQELFYGGLSKKSERMISELRKEDFGGREPKTRSGGVKNIAKSSSVIAGTRLVREWNGNRYEVIVRETGFEYNGQLYRSLTAIATEITGTKWSGNLFFGLKKKS